jgi:hypothetical protein
VTYFSLSFGADPIILLYWVVTNFGLLEFHLFVGRIELQAIPCGNAVNANRPRKPALIDKLQEFLFAHCEIRSRTCGAEGARRVCDTVR